MQIDPIYNTPQKRLTNISGVVKKLIKKDMPWFDRAISPKRLLFGLYVYYQNTLKREKALIETVNKQKATIEELRDIIKVLEEYEKEVIYKGYRAEIITYSWSCGDGCCSDSWCGYAIYDQLDSVVETVGSSESNNYMDVSNCKKRIKEDYGDIPINDSERVDV